MKRFPTPKNSLVAKLVLAFILAAVPPMLLSGYIMGQLVSKSMNMSVEHWLREGTAYIFSLVEDMESQIAALQDLEAPHFTGHEVVFAPGELEAVHTLGIDFIILTDADDRVLFSTPEGVSIQKAPLFPGGSLYIVRLPGGESALAIAEKRRLTAVDGTARELAMGTLFSIELSESGADPLELRIYLPEDDGFREVYSSRPQARFVLPHNALQAALSGTPDFFLPGQDWTEGNTGDHYLLTARRDAQGTVRALFAVSAVMRPPGGALPSSATVFWLFILLGALLSGGLGYLLAKGLVHPIKQLNEAVRHITTGNLEHRIPVHGSDEVAELGANFNTMSNQLEIARHESIENSRQERARMLGEIAIGFAHEIRNPLVVIKTSAELARNALDPQQRETRLLRFVVEEVSRIDTLLSEFLNFARPTPLKLTSFPFKPLVESVLEISAPELEKRGITWTLDDETPAPAKTGAAADANISILGEQNRIRQVLLNLVLNAMEAMPEGGALHLRLYASPDNKMLYLDVADSGKGISEELAKSVHLPFMSTKKNSLGLGLAVVYAIIEAHGGSISFTSAPGRGTTFTVGLKR